MKKNRINPIEPIRPIPKNPPKRKKPEEPKKKEPPKKKGRLSITKQMPRKALEHWSCDILQVLTRLEMARNYKYASTKDQQIDDCLFILKNLQEYINYWRDLR